MPRADSMIRYGREGGERGRDLSEYKHKEVRMSLHDACYGRIHNTPLLSGVRSTGTTLTAKHPRRFTSRRESKKRGIKDMKKPMELVAWTRLC
eukprot:scaffold9235_cov31-Tisochrysis_lutea.AAC.1